jgi:hypothetical protein
MLLIRQSVSYLILSVVVAWVVLIVPNINAGLSDSNNNQILATQIFTLIATGFAFIALIGTAKSVVSSRLSKWKRVLLTIWTIATLAIIWNFYMFDLTKIGTNF